ncbi:hypothetical protein Hanom_Chr15g01379621 [Helianthus anomalus]
MFLWVCISSNIFFTRFASSIADIIIAFIFITVIRDRATDVSLLCIQLTVLCNTKPI